MKTIWLNSVKGHKLRVLEWGNGTNTCILIHGTADGAYVWSPVMESLASTHRVFAIDLRGHGHSDWSPDGLYKIQDYLEDLTFVTNALELTSYCLAGHSMGADIAIRLASERGARVTQLALLDFGPDINLASAGRADAALRGDRCSYSSSEDYYEILRERHLLATDEVLRRAAAETLRETDGAYHLRWDERILDGDTAPHSEALWSMLGKISCPTLIARAVGSAVLSKQTAAQMARIVPNAALAEIPISGHTVLLDNPEDVTAIVCQFFRSPSGNKPRLH